VKDMRRDPSPGNGLAHMPYSDRRTCYVADLNPFEWW
jgi:hypothetical protein